MPNPLPRLVLGCVVACAVGGPTPRAHAAAHFHAGPTEDVLPDRVIAVPPFVIVGDLADAARTKLEDELLAGLERAGLKVVAPKAVSGAFEKLPCESAGCISKLGKAVEATHVLQVTIEQDGRDYEIRMVLSATRDGSELATVAQTCEICGVFEIGEIIADRSTSFKDKLGMVPGTLIVETNPTGAIVRVDGDVVGASPVVEEVAPGKHLVEVEKAGFHPRKRELTVVEGAEESISLTLAVNEQTTEQTEKKKPLLPVLGWTSFALGVGLVGSGVPLIVLDGRPVKRRCTGDNVDANGVCRFRYNTLTTGAVLTGVGGALLVTGIALVATHAKRKGKERKAGKARASAYIGPTDFGVVVRF